MHNPVHRASYQNLPTPYQGPPDPRFSNPGSPRTAGEAKSSLFEALEILRHGKWYIIGITTFVLFAVALYTFTAEPEYEAFTLLMVDTDASEHTDMLALEGIISSAPVKTSLENQYLILTQSLAIANRTADSLIELQRLPVSGEPLDILQGATSVNQLATLLQEDLLTISPSSENTDALEIVATSNTAEEAALIAGIYAAEYLRETEYMLKNELTQLRVFYEDKYEAKKEELEDIESQFAAFLQSESATALDDQVSYLVAQIAQMEGILETARVELSMSESHLKSLENEIAELPAIISESITSNVDTKIEAKQKEIEEIESFVDQIYRKNPELRANPAATPELRGYNQDIARLRSELRALATQKAEILIRGVGSTADGQSMEYVRLLHEKHQQEKLINSGKHAQVRSLQQRLEEYNRRLKVIPDVAREITQLERQQKSAEKLFTLYSSKLEQIRTAEQSATGFARIIREAIPPEKAVKPQKAINLILGLLLGLMLGITAAVARRKLDTKVYSPEDFNHSDINMLGVVPDMRHLIKTEFGRRARINFQGREVSTALGALLAPMSPIAEAYRRLYIKLQFSRDDMGIQNLMITSPKSGAGKSTTALNLAFTSAQAGKRTLVVDADLRRPSLHEKLGLPEGPSILELLSEDENRWDTERFFTGIENMYVITGVPVSQPAELLGSRNMMELIDRFRTEFDIIIFDTPPVLGAVDPVLLSRQCDAVIVVASSDGTDMEALKQTIDELRSVSANVLGTVLNRFDTSSMLRYKSTYGYGYNYGLDSYAHDEFVMSRSE